LKGETIITTNCEKRRHALLRKLDHLINLGGSLREIERTMDKIIELGRWKREQEKGGKTNE